MSNSQNQKFRSKARGSEKKRDILNTEALTNKSFAPNSSFSKNKQTVISKKDTPDSVVTPVEKEFENPLLLYKKNQERAKAPIYTTSSKSNWSQLGVVTIGLATPTRIRQWAEKTLPNGKVVGEVTNANTLHHKTFKPIKGGLFCERIFGPLKDFECSCSNSLGKKIKKFKKDNRLAKSVGTESKDHINASGVALNLQKLLEQKVTMRNARNASDIKNKLRFFCPQCDVEYTWSVMRRYQLGYINLNAPVAHVWYLKSTPNYLSLLLDMKKKHILSLTYCTETLTLENALKSSSEAFIPMSHLGSRLQAFTGVAENNPGGVEADSKNSLSKQSQNHYAKNSVKQDKKTTYYFRTLQGPSIHLASSKLEVLLNYDNLRSILTNQKHFTSNSYSVTNAKRKFQKSLLNLSCYRDLNSYVVQSNQLNYLKAQNYKMLRTVYINTNPIDLNTNTLFESISDSEQSTELQTVYRIRCQAIKQLTHFWKSNPAPRKKMGNHNFVQSVRTHLDVSTSFGQKSLYNKITKLANVESFYRVKNLLKKNSVVTRENKFVGNKVRLAYLVSLSKYFNKIGGAGLSNSEKNLSALAVEKFSLRTPKKKRGAVFRKKQVVIFEILLKMLIQQSKDVSNILKLVSKKKSDLMLQKLATAMHFMAQQTSHGMNLAKTIDIVMLRQQVWIAKNVKIQSNNSLGLAKQDLFGPNSFSKKLYYNNLSKVLFIKECLVSLIMGSIYLSNRWDINLAAVLPKKLTLCSEKKQNQSFLLPQEFLPRLVLRLKLLTRNNTSLEKILSRNKTLGLAPLFDSEYVLYKAVPKNKSLSFRSLKEKNQKRPATPEGSYRQKTDSRTNQAAPGVFFGTKQSLRSAEVNTSSDRLPNIVNNLYCFSHRLLWTHAVDWQFFTLYYFNSGSQKLVLTKSLDSDLRRQSVDQRMSSLDDINVPIYAYRNYDFSLLNTFFSTLDQQSTTADKQKIVPNFTQALVSAEDKQNLHINYSGAGILKTLLAEFDNIEIQKMYKQYVMILFALNKRILKTKQLLYKTLSEQKILSANVKLKNSSGVKTKSKPTTFESNNTKVVKPSVYKKELKELSQQRELLLRKIKLVRKLFTSPANLTSNKQSQQFMTIGAKSTVKDMVLTLLPVLPPDLRPIVKMGSQIAASDLNRFYQRIIYRNDRLKRFLKDPAINGSYEMKYAQRLLQEAVDNLIQNGKSGVTPEKDARGRLLKSLSDILKGKQGRFRQYLLGKRVDYSGRSVIVVGPTLKLHECGIPKEMALELFLPFLIKRILTDNLARTVIGAKTLIQTNKPLTWSLLREILKGSPVLLNRAPTLHRLGFQAFQPKLVDGRAILLHPLVCPAFNADFDGDQMAVHVPISPEARAEAWKLMLSRNNLLSPATGEPLVLPSQDMVLGCYYLTTNTNFKTQKNEKGYGFYFNSLNDVLRAYQQGLLSTHAIIWLKWNGKVENNQVKRSSGAFEEPIEIRLNEYGNSHVIYSRSYSSFNYLATNQHASRMPYGVLENNNTTKEQSYLRSFVSNNSKLVSCNTVIRTTPGKILFNVMLGMSLGSKDATQF